MTLRTWAYSQLQQKQHETLTPVYSPQIPQAPAANLEVHVSFALSKNRTIGGEIGGEIGGARDAGLYAYVQNL